MTSTTTALPFYRVDAFTDHAFGGNPAAVVPLEAWLPDETLQAIALENNLSETAFLVPDGDDWRLRWFTPSVEVDLCGHATLASGHVVLEYLRPGSRTVRFHTKSGELTVTAGDEGLEMDFPSHAPTPIDPPPGLLDALGGGEAEEVLGGSIYLLVVYASEAEVRRVVPDEVGLLAIDAHGVIVTAPGKDVDFVSRFFAPHAGVLEDPVTGSAHCVSTPYWAKRLGRPKLRARQISTRVGELLCEDRGERVGITGRALVTLEGTLHF